MLRALQAADSGHVVRAFADDTALLATSLSGSLPKLQGIFAEFAAASHLQLNMEKTVVIPLGDRRPEEVAIALATQHHSWAVMKFASSGKYLGFWIGPEKGDKSWQAPVRKFLDRVRAWNWSILGLHGAALVYNCMILPVLLFIAQLEQPPAFALDAEVWALRRIAPGPYRWALPEDLWRLRTAFGFSFRFRRLEWAAMAAKARVFACEAHLSGGLRLGIRSRCLLEAQQSSEQVVREARLKPWITAAGCSILCAVVESLQQQGIGPNHAIRDLSRREPRPWPRHTERAVRKGLQSWIYQKLEEPPPGWPERRMRHKFERWRLNLFPRRSVPRVLDALRRLAHLVPPRVAAAVLSSLFNRWCTSRRFQGWRGRCCFGCDAEDRLEHYLRCPVGHEFGAKRLGLRIAAADRWETMLLAGQMIAQDACSNADDTLRRVALLHYVLYRAHNVLRHHAGPSSTPEWHRLFNQCLVEAVRGQSGAISTSM